MQPTSSLRQNAPETQQQDATTARSAADEVAMLSDGLADAAPGEALAVEVITSLAAAESVWRGLEAVGLMTPYQRFDWIRPWAEAHRIERLAVVVIRAAGAPVALLPLQLSRRQGLIRGDIIGSEIGNSDWLLHDPRAAHLLTAAALRAAFAEVASALGGVDYLVFANQPRDWQGTPNPLLAFPHQLASDHFYTAQVGQLPLPKKRRVDILRGKRRLEEGFGPVHLSRAETPAEIAEAHEAFLAHRNTRFAVMGVDNVFARPDFVSFFQHAAEAGVGQANPALCFHALHAGDHLVATAIGAYTATHYSQYINSNTDGPASRYSLMGLLMFELMQELETSGLTSIDMGIGNFAYKTSWTLPVEVFDSIMPLSAKGRLVAPVLRFAGRMKRKIKANPRLFDFAKRIRRMVQNLARRGGAS